MGTRRYYHQRSGAPQAPRLDLEGLKRLIASSIEMLSDRDYSRKRSGTTASMLVLCRGRADPT